MMREEFAPTARLKRICRQLGKKYSIKRIDWEPVIYRDFKNGYDVEISGLNEKYGKAYIYLWKNAQVIVKSIQKVHVKDIAKVVDNLYLEVCKI